MICLLSVLRFTVSKNRSINQASKSSKHHYISIIHIPLSCQLRSHRFQLSRSLKLFYIVPSPHMDLYLRHRSHTSTPFKQLVCVHILAVNCVAYYPPFVWSSQLPNLLMIGQSLEFAINTLCHINEQRHPLSPSSLNIRCIIPHHKHKSPPQLPPPSYLYPSRSNNLPT